MRIHFKNHKPTNVQLDIIYIQDFLKENEKNNYYKGMLNLNWKNEKIKLFGKLHNVPRLIAWYGDSNSHYKYSGVVHYPTPWTTLLLEIKNKIELNVDHKFNAVLANLYRNGHDSMGWHSDNEKELGEKPVIASLSLGQVRRMLFKDRNTKKTYKLDLESGSLLLMRGDTQQRFLHSITKTKKKCNPRINLTFRKIIRTPNDYVNI